MNDIIMESSSASKTKAVRFGVAGLGVAFNFLARSIQGRSHLVLAGACDVRQGALDKFSAQFGGETHLDFEEMCKSPNIDVIYVMTPNPLHQDQVITAAKHGKHIIVDKPMATSIEACEAMNEAAETNGVILMCGHSHSYGPAVRAMRRAISSGEIGPLRMINTWHFNDWLYRPRARWELEPDGGGNLVFNQGAHQVDIVRVIGGGLVRSVRSTMGVWDPARPIEGAYTAFLDFEDGSAATLVYNAYAHFDTAELTGWVGEGPRDPERNAGARKRLAGLASAGDEFSAKEAWRYGGAHAGGSSGQTLTHFGLTIVSGERGDIRQSPTGLSIYGDHGRREVLVPPTTNQSNGALENMYEVLHEGGKVLRSGRWGQATTEVLLAIMRSAKERREITLHHQVEGVE